MTSSRELKRRKQELRARVRALRDAMPRSERQQRSRAIADRLIALPEVRGARTVMLFSSFGSEVETGTMIELLVASGSRIALPRVEAGGVAAVAHHPGEPLRRASFGALEPVQGRVLPAGDLDVVVVPGLAFDRNGYRVGYGGGFYDRFLQLVRGDAFRVGVAFSLQVVDEVPHGSGDVALHAIVTDDEEIRCR